MLKVCGVERAVGLDDGVGVVLGRPSTGDWVGRGVAGSISTSGVGVNEGVGRGVGVVEGLGDGVGVGVLTFAL